MHGSMSRLTLACLACCLFGTVVGCGSKERATVAFEYCLNPSKGLPQGMTAIAILDAQVNEVTDRKWSELAANFIQDLIQDSNDRYGTKLRIADRKHTSSVMQESDMKAAGLVASSQAGQVAQVLDVQGLIMAEINVKVETHKGKGTTISGLSGFGGSYFGGGSVQTREVDKTSRSITVQTAFKLVDTTTSENWATHSPSPYQQTDKTKVSPFFGSAKTEEAMTPRDEIIAAAVESGAREFVSKMIPCTVRYEVQLESSGQENCARGVSYLRGDMPTEAIGQFKAALMENPDDSQAAFAAGVACEMMGRYQEALGYYKQACVLEDDPNYVVARKRMAANADRIRPGEAS